MSIESIERVIDNFLSSDQLDDEFLTMLEYYSSQDYDLHRYMLSRDFNNEQDLEDMLDIWFAEEYIPQYIEMVTNKFSKIGTSLVRDHSYFVDFLTKWGIAHDPNSTVFEAIELLGNRCPEFLQDVVIMFKPLLKDTTN